jgi:hypothetical protein
MQTYSTFAGGSYSIERLWCLAKADGSMRNNFAGARFGELVPQVPMTLLVRERLSHSNAHRDCRNSV